MRGALIATLVSGLGSAGYGYAASVLSTTLAQPSFNEKFGLATRADAVTLITCMVTFFFLGGLFGAASLGPLADRYGRRGMLLIACILSIVFIGIEVGSSNVEMFIAMRTLSGIPLAQFFSLVPLYISECAPHKIRGTLTNFSGLALAIGYTIASWANEGFSRLDGAYAWRIPLAIQAVFPLILLPCLLFMPESPRWLVNKGRNEQALSVLSLMHGNKDHQATLFVKEEFDLLIKADELERQHPVTWAIIFKRRSNIKRAYLTFLVTFQYVALGTLGMGQYFPKLLNGLNFSPANQLLIAAGWITISLPGNAASMYLVEKIGRRKSFLIGYIGVITTTIAECVTLAVGGNSVIGQRLAVAWLFLNPCFFAPFVDATTWCYAAEIWPNHLRAKGFSIGMCTFYASATLFVGVSFPAFSAINEYFYIIYIVTSSIVTGLAFVYLPETTGLPMEALAQLFGDDYVDESGIEHTSGAHSEDAEKGTEDRKD